MSVCLLTELISVYRLVIKSVQSSGVQADHVSVYFGFLLFISAMFSDLFAKRFKYQSDSLPRCLTKLTYSF